jgi:hypothetical protein
MSVEVQSDLGGGWMPVGGVVSTAGFTAIRLALQPPQIASALCLRFYRPNDASVVGLSHLKIMASTVFGGADLEQPSSSSQITG